MAVRHYIQICADRGDYAAADPGHVWIRVCQEDQASIDLHFGSGSERGKDLFGGPGAVAAHSPHDSEFTDLVVSQEIPVSAEQVEKLLGRFAELEEAKDRVDYNLVESIPIFDGGQSKPVDGRRSHNCVSFTFDLARCAGIEVVEHWYGRAQIPRGVAAKIEERWPSRPQPDAEAQAKARLEKQHALDGSSEIAGKVAEFERNLQRVRNEMASDSEKAKRNRERDTGRDREDP